MEVSATLKSAKISAQKARLVADLIRGCAVDQALATLRFSQKKCGAILVKLLNSAIANAEHNYGLDIDDLKVSTIYVNTGSPGKRWHARAKGRGCRVVKHSSHITIKVSNAS